MKKRDITAVIGLVVPVLVILAIVVMEIVRPGDFPGVAVIREWQGLLGAAAALTAAAIAAFYVAKQMRQMQDLEKDRYGRMRRGWMAMMSATMHQVSEYATLAYSSRSKLHDYARDHEAAPSNNAHPKPSRIEVAFPELAPNLLHEIRTMVEHAGHDDEAQQYAEVLRITHGIFMRWEQRRPQLADPSHIEGVMTAPDEMVRTAELFARSANLANASRAWPSATQSKPWSRVLALKHLSQNRPIDPEIMDCAEERDRATPLP